MRRSRREPTEHAAIVTRAARHLDGALDARPPIGIGPADHPRDQVDVDLLKARFQRDAVGLLDLLGAVRPVVALQNFGVEVFDAEA